MKPTSLHSIVCLEGEWQFNNKKKKYRFSMDTEPILNWLQKIHDCGVIYRHILTREDLAHYLKYFSMHTREMNGSDIVYFACHGAAGHLELEGKDKLISLSDLADMAKGFFENKIVHFSSCSTMDDLEAVEEFKKKSGARMVSGYGVTVDAAKSSIADIAYFDYLMKTQNVGIVKNLDRSTFYKTYGTLLTELHFIAV